MSQPSQPSQPSQQVIFNDITIKEFCGKTPILLEILGGSSSGSDLKTQEVGDGNLNFVWIVQGPKSSIVLKQAADFIRIAPSWKLTVRRVWWERSALVEQYKHAPNHVPKQFFFDESYAVNAMEYLSDHIILRKGLIANVVYPNLEQHVSQFLASTLFHTSDLFLKSEEKRKLMTIFVDNALVHLTEAVIFHEPYVDHPNNHWTKNAALEKEILTVIRSDNLLMEQVSNLKYKFMNFSQALLHGDLHTGSVMVNQEQTFVIDPEFAFFGPIGFDIGAFVANIWLSYFSQDGYTKLDTLDRTQYKNWLLEVSVNTVELFNKKFIDLWDTKHNGQSHMIGNKTVLQQHYLSEIFADTLGFAGCKMIRRIIGIAHVVDFESIKDDEIRAECEIKVLRFASTLIKQRYSFKSVHEVILLLKQQ